MRFSLFVVLAAMRTSVTWFEQQCVPFGGHINASNCTWQNKLYGICSSCMNKLSAAVCITVQKTVLCLSHLNTHQVQCSTSDAGG